MEEIWEDIRGYDGLYQISNFGNVKSLPHTVDRIKKGKFPINERILKPGTFRGGGYFFVVPNKNNMNPNIEMMPFKKFAEKEGFIYNEETIRIEGTFRKKDTGEIVKGDIFDVHLLSGQSIDNIYKVYLKWFNYTRIDPSEKEREFVSVKQIKEETESDE